LPQKREDWSYYTFQDFFFSGPGDKAFPGVVVRWDYSGHEPLEIRKQSTKWMRYERRPKLPVEFLGISRAVPAIEQRVLRNHFSARRSLSSLPLSKEGIKWISNVLQKSYKQAESLSSEKYALRRCRTSSDQSYSSFNMGAGEDVLIDIVSTLDRVPEGALIVIEEIEIGIHAAALRRLAAVLQEAALKRKLQIIVSSHSEHFVDSLPRLARILVQRGEGAHLALNSPSTRFVFSCLDNAPNPEITIMCEDEFASGLVRYALDPRLVKRVSIQGVGSVETVARVAAGHMRAAPRERCLVIWDGDVGEDQAKQIAADAANACGLSSSLMYERLPGPEAPEKMAAKMVMSTASSCQLLADELRVESASQIHSLLEEALCEADHHSVPQYLARRSGVTEETAANALIRACIAAAPERFDEIRSRVAEMLA